MARKKVEYYTVCNDYATERIYNAFVRGLEIAENAEKSPTKKAKIMQAKTDLRNAKIQAELAHVENSAFRAYCGMHNAALGLAFELACSYVGISCKTCVAKTGRDNTVYVDGKGYSLECKTNGGGIARMLEHYYDGRAVNEYVAYFYDVCNSSNGGERQVFEPRLIPMTAFVEFFLEHPNAYKNDAEKHIQPSNAAFKQFIDNWPVSFEFDTMYTASDFED